MEKTTPNGSGQGLEAVSSGSSESLLQQSIKKSKNIYTNRSYRLNVINWWNVYVQVFIPYTFFGVLGLLIANTIYEMQNLHLGTTALTSIVLESRDVLLEQHGLGMRIAAVVLIVLVYLAYRERPVYLVDFSTFKAPDHWKVTQDELLLIMERQGCYEKGSLEFMRKILEKSGTSNHTAWPPNFTKCVKEDIKGDDSIEAAREESKAVIFGCIDDLIKKTGLQMKKVDFLIINCSLFSPTPSLCALVANHYTMKPDIQSYNLSGMGCSASVLSIELARQLLASNPGCTALVVSTENLTQNMYYGNERGMLLQNTLFRCGGAAILLSNRWGDGLRAKYKLLHAVRTTNAKQDAYDAVYECQDKDLNRGIRLSKDIVQVAGRTMKQNLTALGPYVLPVREQTKVVISMVGAAVTKKTPNHSRKERQIGSRSQNS
eukprot:comp12363_c0_seq1/m.7246 comp12363_c0_seq1/g.7246  ORF comp12363_c0_seq1/g.7246 comp12363_c0_seq1/m.7246 type:complete len:432 (-) comp12363_c0_seq1:444-1739(-)